MYRPAMPENNAAKTEYVWYCRKFLATFLAAAPGRTNREFKISRPTQEIASVTITAIATVKAVWVAFREIPRDDASWG